jgi:anion-transporting  ArsA/GET3 family ATPase
MISQSDLGRALGLSKQAISKLKGQGMPVDSVAAAQAWREARQNVAARKPVPDAAPRVAPFVPVSVRGVPVFGGGPIDLPDLPNEDRDTARTRREIAEANMAEMAEARQRREQILVSAVQTALSTDYATTRDAMLQIPARMAPLLAAESDPAAVQNLLHTEIHQALMQIAGASDQLPNIEGAFD